MGEQLKMFTEPEECKETAKKIKELINSKDSRSQLIGLELCKTFGYSKVKFVQDFFNQNTPNEWFERFFDEEVCDVFFAGLRFSIYEDDDYNLMIKAYNIDTPSRVSNPVQLYSWSNQSLSANIDNIANKNISKFVNDYFFDLLSLLK